MESSLRQRRHALLDRMGRAGFEAALATKPASLYYLTGLMLDPHERFAGAFLFGEEDYALVVPALDKLAAERAAPRVFAYTDAEGPEEALRAAFGTRRPRRLAVEKEHFSLERAEWIEGIYSGISYDSLSPLIDHARARKDAAEVAIMRRAAKIIDESLAAAIAQVRAGMAELELAGVLEMEAKKRGASKMSFGTLILSGAKSAEPHGETGSDPIQEGQLLLVDAGVVFQGYCSDITRVFHVGETAPRLREMYETVLRANKLAIAAAKPGVRFADVDKAARDHIASKGMGEQFIHRLGHGLGLEIHEYPSVSAACDDAILPGHAFTIEPGVYVPGVGGVRIEDDVVATDDGVEVLTSFPKEWDRCGVALG